MTRKVCTLTFVALMLGLWCVSEIPAITIQLDYRFDTQNFFDTEEKRAAITAAASFYEARIFDSLDPLQPGGFNTWSATFVDPATGNERDISGLEVPADTLIVFVGGHDIGGSTLGFGGPGGFNARGDSAWLQRVQSRGEENAIGEGASDFGPWGGSIVFDTLDNGGNPKNWHFGIDELPEVGQFDFLTTAVHELGHLLGFGTSESWRTLVDHTAVQFMGLNATGEHGGHVDLEFDSAHWLEGTRGISIDAGVSQEALMDPSQIVGTRKLLTWLDLAALDDIGWEIDYSVELLGDVNRDLVVDLIDFGILKGNFGLPGEALDGDLTEDGVIGLEDFVILKDNFGSMAVGPRGVAVPEPDTSQMAWTLLALIASLPGLGQAMIRSSYRPGNRLIMLLGVLMPWPCQAADFHLEHVESLPLPPVMQDGKPVPIHTQGLFLTKDWYYITGRMEMAPRQPWLLRIDRATRSRIEYVSLTGFAAETGDTSGLDHPGGMDSDGTRLWIPVAESRHGGRTAIMTFPLDSRGALAECQATVVFWVNDHLGALAVDRDNEQLFGANWDTRDIYIFDMRGNTLAKIPREEWLPQRPSWFLAVQDWKWDPSLGLVAGGLDKSREEHQAVVERHDLAPRRLQYRISVGSTPDRDIPLTREGLALENDDLWLLPGDFGHEGPTLYHYRLVEAD